jgi:hypothetical protein
MVEMAIVAPVLVMLVLLAFEMSLLLRETMTVQSATRAGARVGSSAHTTRLSDYETLQAVRAGLGDTPASDVQLVIVFKPDGNGLMDPACRTASVADLCNRYTGADFSRSVSDFDTGASCPASAPDHHWCPSDRNRDQASPGGPDWFGVHVEVLHRTVGWIPDRTVADTVVMRLEPRYTP